MNNPFLRRLEANVNKHNRTNFILALPPHARVLDVGCGNGSPYLVKSLRPDLYYVGIDVADYNQVTPHDYADVYEIVSPDDFHRAIEKFTQTMDAVMSSHNLEHCDQPQEVLKAMTSALKPGGQLFLSFPCEESVRFPHRTGTLNFYDDQSHQSVPNWTQTLLQLRSSSMEITQAIKHARPALLYLLGLVLEPFSMLFKKKLPGTWYLYGFESRICATRKS